MPHTYQVRDFVPKLATALGRDVDGQLWVGTRNGGLSKFDPVRGRFTPRPFATGDNAANFQVKVASTGFR